MNSDTTTVLVDAETSVSGPTVAVITGGDESTATSQTAKPGVSDPTVSMSLYWSAILSASVSRNVRNETIGPS